MSASLIGNSLDYNPETGKFRWKVTKGARAVSGEFAGSKGNSSGYSEIQIDGKIHQAHRLAWLLTYGKWPEGVIDHIDGDRLNNKISNLRDVSRSVNMQNQRRAQSSNSTGLLGVTFNKGNSKFQAQIMLNGEQNHLGYFTTAEEAHAAYLAVKRQLHEGCTI